MYLPCQLDDKVIKIEGCLETDLLKVLILV